MFLKTHFLKKHENIVNDRRVEEFISAYLSFRKSGCSYIEAVSVARQGCGKEAPSEFHLVQHGVRCMEKIFKPYLNTLYIKDRYELLLNIRQQLKNDPCMVAKVSALAQLSSCLDLIDWSNVEISQIASLESNSLYINCLTTGNPYVILMHAKLLTELIKIPLESNKQYLLEQFANLKINSDQIGSEFGFLALYVKAMTNNLFTQCLSNRGEGKEQTYLCIKAASELSHRAINHVEQINLIDEMIITGKSSENQTEIQQVINSLLKF